MGVAREGQDVDQTCMFGVYLQRVQDGLYLQVRLDLLELDYHYMEYTAFIRNAHRLTTRRHPRISVSCTRTCTITTQAEGQRPIIHIPTGSYIYAFGAPSHTSSPLLRDLGWTVNDGEAWAIISGGGGRGKKIIFNVSLLIRLRVSSLKKKKLTSVDTLRKHSCCTSFGSWKPMG